MISKPQPKEKVPKPPAAKTPRQRTTDISIAHQLETVMKRTLIANFPYARAEIEQGEFAPMPNWPSGRAPHNKLQIDEEIASLMAQSVNINFRTRSELVALVERRWPPKNTNSSLKAAAACPYWRTRWWIAYAAYSAEEAVLVRRGCRLRLKKKVALIRALSKGVDDLLLDFKESDFAPIIPLRMDRLDLDACFRDVNRAAELRAEITPCGAALKELKALAEAECQRHATPNPDDENLWLQTFAEAMAHLWDFLTGELPSSSSKHFVKFVRQGYASINYALGRPDKDEWESNIRAAIERVNGVKRKNGRVQSGRPFWDQFDRDSKNYDPDRLFPTDVELREYIEECRRSGGDWKYDLRSIYEKTFSNDSIEKHAAEFMLLSLYSLEDVEVRAFADSLGYRPPSGPECVIISGLDSESEAFL